MFTMDNPHKQSLRKIGTIFGNFGEYNTDNWTHVQLGDQYKLHQLFDETTALFRTVIAAIQSGTGESPVGDSGDSVRLSFEDGEYRLHLRLNCGDIQRIYPIIVVTTTLMVN